MRTKNEILKPIEALTSPEIVQQLRDSHPVITLGNVFGLAKAGQPLRLADYLMTEPDFAAEFGLPLLTEAYEMQAEREEQMAQLMETGTVKSSRVYWFSPRTPEHYRGMAAMSRQKAVFFRKLTS